MPCLIPVLCVPDPMTPAAVTSDTAPRLGSARQCERDTRDQLVFPGTMGPAGMQVEASESRIVESCLAWVLIPHLPWLSLSDWPALLLSEPQFLHPGGLSDEPGGERLCSEGRLACLILGFPQLRTSLLSVLRPSTVSFPLTQGPSGPANTSLDPAYQGLKRPLGEPGPNGIQRCPRQV